MRDSYENHYYISDVYDVYIPGCINSDNDTESIFHGDIISDARPISDFTLQVITQVMILNKN